MRQTKNLKNQNKCSKLSKSEINTLFMRLRALNPNPSTELNYHNHFTLLVAVALSAQATDKSVNKATEPLFKFINKPQDILDLGEEKLATYLSSINFYPTKTRNVMALSQRLLEVFDGKVPDNRKDLESLPGVGRKTANVVLSIAFCQATIAVDTHIFRVSNRTGLAPGATPLEVETCLEKAIPEEWLVDAHHWLILHGRYVCKARKPDCHKCAIVDICRYQDKVL